MQQRINVMQVVLSLRVGGLERVVVDLVNHTSDEFRFVVCCLEEAGAWANQINPSRAKVVSLGKRPGLDWRMISGISKLARAEKIRIVHTHNYTAHLYGALGAKLAGVKVLHTEHGKNLDDAASGYRLNRIAARFTDLTVAVSQKNAELAVSHEGVSPGKLAVLPNGIPVEKFSQPVDSPALRRSLGLPTDAKLVGTVGRLVREKNYPLLLRAFEQLPDAFLAFVGDGLLRQDLEREAETRKISQRVLFLGQRTDVAQLLGSFDVFVLSSSTEGMSMALLEAMAAGCPIVVTAVGGNIELIQDGVTGAVVPPDDAEKLTAQLWAMLTDRARAVSLGAAARERARRLYSVQEMSRRYEQLWRRLAM